MAEELIIRVVFDNSRLNKGLSDSAQRSKALAGTLGALDKSIRDYERFIRNRLKPGTDAYATSMKRLSLLQNKVRTGTQQATKALHDTTRAQASVATSLQALNFTVRDSPYFARDFSLGVLAVGNNLNPLIDGLIRVKQEAKASGASLISFLRSAISPTQAAVLAFSFLVSILQAVIFAMDKTGDEAEETAKKFEDLAAKIRDYTEGLGSISETNKKIIEENKKALEESDIEGIVKFRTGGDITKIQEIYGNAFIGMKDGVSSVNLALIDNQDLLERTIQAAAKAGQKVAAPLLKQLRLRREVNAGLADSVKLNLETAKAIEKAIKSGGDLNEKLKQFPINAIRSFSTSFEKAFAKIPQNWEETTIRVTDANGKIIESFQLTRTQLESLQNAMSSGKVTKELNAQKDSVDALVLLWSDFAKVIGDADFLTALAGGNKEVKKLLENLRSVPKELKPVEVGEKPDEVKEAAKFLQDKDKIENMRTLNSLATSVGNNLFQAFIHGKEGVDEFMKSLAATIAQMLIIDGLKSIFTGGAVGIFKLLGFSQGGIVKAAGGTVIPGTSYTGDRIPALVNSGEMILNRQQQAELFNMVKGIGVQKTKQNINVVVSGELTANKTKFIAKLKQAQNVFDRGVKIGTLGKT